MDTRAIAELAHPIFVANDWHWSTCAGVPTPADIQNTIDYLIKRVEEIPDATYSSTGRFRVSKFTEDGVVEILVSLELGNEYR